MTPLEAARANKNKPKEITICCAECGNMVVIDNLAYCESNGKIIMSMHLETRRDNQCKDIYIERKGEIRIEN